ncbi:MAG TPA: lipase family protein [Methylocella sp.]|nr:lipase family protein [Methylocella sp.]
MPISDSDAVKFGLLVMYAEDMYTDGTKIPVIDPRIREAGWEVIGYLTARDAILPERASLLPGQKKIIKLGDVVFYGFLARCIADPDQYTVAVRGTSGLAEWIIDAEFLPIPNPREPGTKVEQGFWDIYDSMSLINLDGSVINDVAAKGIVDKVGKDRVVVAGHSLGSALATYLSLETAKLLGPRLSACMFASPRTGDAAWAGLYDKTVSDYRLFNYVLDVVPYVPFDVPPDIQYSTLSKATIIQPSTAQADVRLDIACDHHIICYCAMLDYEYTKQTPLEPQDQSLWACVIGPHEMSFNAEAAIALAAIITHLGVAKQIVELLRVRLHWTGNA